MPTLLDHIDRFSYTARAIQTVATTASKTLQAPYVSALLRTPLEDLARDVDPSELGLFTLVPNASSASTPGDEVSTSNAEKRSVVRTQFPGATPLRRPAGAPKHVRRENDKEPELYAEAALKYLDRYQSIRPMPRARQEVEAIIERLNSLRGDIALLSEAADQIGKSAPQHAPTLQDEEKRVQEITMRIKQMKARKDVLLKRHKPGNKPSPMKAKDKEEAAFWSDPTSSRKTRPARKSLLIPTLARGAIGPDDTLLLDSHMKVDTGEMLGDVSMDSLVNAVPTPMPSSRAAQVSDETPLPAAAPRSSRSPSPSPVPFLVPTTEDQSAIEDSFADDSVDLDADGDTTVMIAKPLPSEDPPRITPQAPIPSTPLRPAETPVYNALATPDPGITATPGTARIGRVKITTDIERIVAKIWSTVGDIIMPGHPFNTAAAATTNKPPRAKETIALLQNLSKQTPPPASPTASHSTLSMSTDPTMPGTHAILTAHLLLALIYAVPRHAMPLAATKTVLAEANKTIGSGTPVNPMEVGLGLLGGGDKAMETRALYGCVAKRLLKIDRSGREQLVRFDV